jgi:hypothetical protein
MYMSLSVFFSGAAFFLCIFFFFFFNRSIRRRTGPDHILAEIRDEVGRLIADIEKSTDDSLTLLEDRVGAVKALLEDVDKRLGLYTRELDKKRLQEKAYAELGRNRLRSAEPPAPRSAPELFVPPGEEGPPPGEGPGQAAADPRFTLAAKEIPPKAPSLPEQAAELARAGFSSNLIASRLGISISEVELAVAIAERKHPR